MINKIENDFTKEVLQCQLPVFVCFATNSCRSCYPVCHSAQKLATDYNGKIKFFKVDVDDNPEIAEKYQVTVVPTILLFRNSQVIEKQIGFKDRCSLNDMLDKVLAENKTST